MTIVGIHMTFEQAFMLAAGLVVGMLLFDGFLIGRLGCKLFFRKLIKGKISKIGASSLFTKKSRQEDNNKSISSPFHDNVGSESEHFLFPPLKKLRPESKDASKERDWYLILRKSLRIFTLFVLPVVVNVGVPLVSGYTMYKLFWTSPRIEYRYPEDRECWETYDKPIEIVFDLPVSKEKMDFKMAPEVKGEWKFEPAIPKLSSLPFSRRVHFYPEESIYPEDQIVIYIVQMTNYLENTDIQEHDLVMRSPALPNISKTDPEDGSEEVAVDKEIEIEFNAPDGDFVEWEFKIEPEANFETYQASERVRKIKFSDRLRQGTDYTVGVSRTPVKYNLSTKEVVEKKETEKVYEFKFKTIPAPLISSFHPEGQTVLPGENIKVVFDQEMVKESVEESFSIDPQVEGTISWEDGRTFVFTPSSPLPKETHYTVKFAKDMRSVGGGVSEEDVEFSFSTIGAVRVIGFNPGSGTHNVKVGTMITVTFDQEVDHGSAQSQFSISPNVGGSLSWSGNSMTFDPSADLAKGTTYNITISKGIKTVHGLDSRDDFHSNFTTEYGTFILDVPQIHQGHRFTCNVTAARMTLAYRGVWLSDEQFVNLTGRDTTPHDTVNNIWGNPHAGYVGDFDGDGYGVYWEPVAAAIGNYRQTSIRSGWNVSGLAKEIENGNPVIIWWQNGWATPNNISWHTPSGQYIYAIAGMHSEVAVGFIGSSDNPTHIITRDPWRGQRTLTVGYFNSLWSYFGNTGVVVY